MKQFLRGEQGNAVICEGARVGWVLSLLHWCSHPPTRPQSLLCLIVVVHQPVIVRDYWQLTSAHMDNNDGQSSSTSSRDSEGTPRTSGKCTRQTRLFVGPTRQTDIPGEWIATNPPDWVKRLLPYFYLMEDPRAKPKVNSRTEWIFFCRTCHLDRSSTKGIKARDAHNVEAHLKVGLR